MVMASTLINNTNKQSTNPVEVNSLVNVSNLQTKFTKKNSKRSCELQNNPIIFIIYYHLIRRLKSSKIPKKAEYGNAHMPLRYMRTPLKGIKAELNSPRFMQQRRPSDEIKVMF